MNSFGVAGAVLSGVGATIFILAAGGVISQTKTNASASIGAVGSIHFLELLIGAFLVVGGLCIAILGGRSKKLP